MSFLPFVLVGAVMAFILYSKVSQSRLRTRTLGEAKKLLQDVATTDTGAVRGCIGGRNLRVDLTTRGSGSSKTSWTEVGVVVSTTVQLSLRPQTLVEAGLTRMARGVDVIVGDEAFDRAFIVDGAPADAVREVLGDAPLRQRLVSLRSAELTQSHAEICLAKKGWVAPDVLGLMVACAVDLATRLERPYTGAGASPYRPAGAGLAADEIAALTQARARRKRLNVILVVAFGFLVLAFPLFEWLRARLGR